MYESASLKVRSISTGRVDTDIDTISTPPRVPEDQLHELAICIPLKKEYRPHGCLFKSLSMMDSSLPTTTSWPPSSLSRPSGCASALPKSKGKRVVVACEGKLCINVASASLGWVRSFIISYPVSFSTRSLKLIICTMDKEDVYADFGC